MNVDIDAVLGGVGGRLRELRNRRGLTLAQLSAETGISVSTLSRLESSLRRPTLDLLIRLAFVYGASLDDIVGAPQIADPRVRPKTFFRDGKAIIPLTGKNADVVAFKMLLPGRDPVAPVERKTHEGFEWIYVLSGQLLLLAGDVEMTLNTGEAFEFDTRKPHAFVSVGPEPAELISLLSTQGERVHLRSDASPHEAL
jgi:transcriptional regulator with XRE-family HTH domain